ncbi:CBS domain protein [Minicystis rosea]|nr:CBS domain protein [Minicystis rosea]
MQLSRFEHGVVIAELNETAGAAARRMRDFRVGCVVVVRESRPVGILTDRDIVLRVVAEGLDAEQTLISAIVTYEAATIPRDAAVETAVRVMSERGVRRIPIVTDDGKVTGIVTADDLTVMFATLLGQIGVGLRDNVDGSESR